MQQLGVAHSAGKIVQNVVHGNSQTANTRLPASLARFNRDDVGVTHSANVLEKGAWGNWNPQPLAHDQRLISSAEAVINVNLKDQTSHVLRTLTPREEKVIKMRFGLDDGSEHTLEEVGQSFAVTRERIRQIEAKALRKLRHPSRSRKLRAFLEGSSRDYL